MKMILGVVRPEMAMDSNSKKWNRCLMRGANIGQHTDWFETVKNNHNLLVGSKLSM